MTMEVKEFTNLLDAHGANLKCWPRDTVAGAQELMTRDVAARNAYAAAQALDRALDMHEAGTLPPAVYDRVMEKVAAMPPSASGDNVTPFTPRAHAGRTRFYYGAVAIAVAIAALWLAVVQPPTVAVGPVTATRTAHMDGQGTNTVPQTAAAAPAAVASADAVDLFVLAMADPFMDNLEADMLVETLDQTAAADMPLDDASVDVFLNSVMDDPLDRWQ